MSEGQQTSGPNKVFVGNLSYFTTNQDLQTIFQPYGEILETKVCVSKDRGPLYYGFVQFQNGEQAKQAVAAVHDMKFLGRRLKVHCQNLQKTQKYQQDSTDKGVQVLFSFVCTQPTSLLLTEGSFESIFLSYGNVIDCIVKSHVCDTRKVIKTTDTSTNETQETSNQHSSENEYLRQGGYGFVTFSDWENAKRVIDTIHLVLLPKHIHQPLNKDDFQLLIKGSTEEASVLSNQGTILNHHGKDMVVLDLDCKLSRTASAQLSNILPSQSETLDQQNNSNTKSSVSNNNNTNIRHPISRLSTLTLSTNNGNHNHINNAHLHQHQLEPQHLSSNHFHANNNIQNLNNANVSSNNNYNNTNLQQHVSSQFNIGSFPTFPPETQSINYFPVPNTDIPSTTINHAIIYPVSNALPGNIQVLPVNNNTHNNHNTVVFVSNNATNGNNNNISMMPNASPSFPSPSSHMQPIFHPLPTNNLPHHTRNTHLYHYTTPQNVASFSPANSPPPPNMVTPHTAHNETYTFPLQPQLQHPPQQQLHNMHLPSNPVYYQSNAPQQMLYPVYGQSPSATHPFQPSQLPVNNANMPYFPQNNRA